MEAGRDELFCSQLLPLWNEISVWAELGEHHDYRVPAELSIITINSYIHCCCTPVQNLSLSPTWETNFMTQLELGLGHWHLWSLKADFTFTFFVQEQWRRACTPGTQAHVHTMAPDIHSQKVLNIYILKYIQKNSVKYLNCQWTPWLRCSWINQQTKIWLLNTQNGIITWQPKKI